MSKSFSPEKKPDCLNCGYQLKEDFEYCPKCSQKNADSHLSFRKLIADFFSNYFSLDSRFGRTFKPFFIQPGLLTIEFMEGKRVKYANPIRLYLVISLIHFFILSFVPSDLESDEPVFSNSEKGEIPEAGMIRFNISEDSVSTDINYDTLIAEKATWFPSVREIELISNLSSSKTFSRKEIQDSLQVEEMPFLKKYTTSQFIKLQLSSPEEVMNQIIKNIPVLMFLLLPFYALILKIFFRKKLYIHHLIHSIHLHSFVFTVLTIVWLISIILGTSTDFVEAASFFLLSFYAFISFRKNYNRSKWNTFFTLLGTGFLYMLVLLFGILIEMLISLMLF